MEYDRLSSSRAQAGKKRQRDDGDEDHERHFPTLLLQSCWRTEIWQTSYVRLESTGRRFLMQSFGGFCYAVGASAELWLDEPFVR
jgi:hypothetical protein